MLQSAWGQIGGRVAGGAVLPQLVGSEHAVGEPAVADGGTLVVFDALEEVAAERALFGPGAALDARNHGSLTQPRVGVFDDFVGGLEVRREEVDGLVVAGGVDDALILPLQLLLERIGQWDALDELVPLAVHALAVVRRKREPGQGVDREPDLAQLSGHGRGFQVGPAHRASATAGRHIAAIMPRA